MSAPGDGPGHLREAVPMSTGSGRRMGMGRFDDGRTTAGPRPSPPRSRPACEPAAALTDRSTTTWSHGGTIDLGDESASRAQPTPWIGRPGPATARPRRPARRTDGVAATALDHRRVPHPDRQCRPLRDRGGARRQPLVHRVRGQQDRDDQPDHARRPPSSPPDRRLPARWGSRRAPTATSGSPSSRQQDRADRPDDPRDHRVRHPDRRSPAPRGSRRARTATSGSPSTSATRSGEINPTTRARSPSSPSRPPAPGRPGSRRVRTATSGSPRAVRDKIGMINPTTHAIAEFPIPSAKSSRSRSRRAPTATSGSPSPGNKIGSINPTTHAIVETTVPTAGSGPDRHHGRPRRQPLVHRVRRQPDRVDQPRHARHRRDRPSPPPRQPQGIAAGPDGNLWFAESGARRSPSSRRRSASSPPPSPRPSSRRRPFGLTVSVYYQSGLPDTGFNGNVTLALVDHASGATLGRHAHRRRPQRRGHLLRPDDRPGRHLPDPGLHRSDHDHRDDRLR